MIFDIKFRHDLILAQVLILGLLAGPAAAQEGRNVPDAKRGFEAVQIERLADDGAVLLWARPTAQGHDLLLGVRDGNGAMAAARRINRAAGDAAVLALDEARPALATDGDDRIGVAWFDADGRLWMTRSDDRGGRFDDPVRVDGGAGRDDHAFVSAAFGPDGTLHVVWLDARDAPPNREEPAHVYHRSWGPRGVSEEVGLTIGHTESVCGCCRPGVHADRHGVDVVYRNVDDGFRDIHVIRRPNGEHWGAPERVGPAMWEIDACPMAGPITDGRTVIWRDGSRDVDRIVEGTTPDTPVRVLVQADEGGWMASPRWVDPDHVFVPGEPGGRLLVRDGGGWTVVRTDLPTWCTDLARFDDAWLMVGDVEGKLELQALSLDAQDD